MTPTTGCYLSIDLEDYKHATMMDMGLEPKPTEASTRAGVERLLLAMPDTTGDKRVTFFSTGQIARDQRRLVLELSSQGHEIGCHTDQHTNVSQMSHEQFSSDLQRCRSVLQDASGQAIEGFRAPNFSMDHTFDWAFEALAERGFVYDSSLVQRQRATGAPAAWDTIETKAGPLYELPLYRHTLGGATIRVIGGTYFRLLPTSLILGLMRSACSAGFLPLIYLHASDLNADGVVKWSEMRRLPMLQRLSWLARQHQWTARVESVPGKLLKVLRHFPNRGPMRSALPA